MQSMAALLDPKAIAVVGASQRPGPGTSVVANLRDAGFKGEIFAVNPRYTDVLGFQCYPSVSDLPKRSIASSSRSRHAACDVLEQAFARGIRAAVVLAAGFDDGGTDGPRGDAAAALATAGHEHLRSQLLRPHQRQDRRGRLQRRGAQDTAPRPGRAGVAKRQPRQFRVQPADARSQARLHLFHLLRQSGRRHDRGLCRVSRRRSGRHRHRRDHRGSEEAAQAARGRRGARGAAKVAGVRSRPAGPPPARS